MHAYAKSRQTAQVHSCTFESVSRAPVQDPESFAKGKALFQSGLLSEAVMALEAEVQRNPQNVDAWRLLGTVHAENDDDQQVRSMTSGDLNLQYCTL